MDFEDILGVGVYLIWDWNVAVTENIVYLKHPVPSVSHFRLFLFQFSKWKSLK